MPAQSPVRSSVVAAFDHKYVYGGVPPSIVASAWPTQAVHTVFVAMILVINGEGSVMVIVDVPVQLLVSVTVTV